MFDVFFDLDGSDSSGATGLGRRVGGGAIHTMFLQCSGPSPSRIASLAEVSDSAPSLAYPAAERRYSDVA